MTHRILTASADGDTAVPETRRTARARERAAEAVAARAAEHRSGSSSVRVVDGSAPIFTSRREMRQAATACALELAVTIGQPLADETPMVAPAPAVGAGVPSAPYAAATIEDHPVIPLDTAETATSPTVSRTAPVASAPVASAPAASVPTQAPLPIDETALVSTLVDVSTATPDLVVPTRRRAVAHPRRYRPSATRPVRRGGARRTLQRLTAAGAFLFIGSLVVVTSLPAQALAPVDSALSTQMTDTGAPQSVAVVDGDQEVFLTRDDFTVNDAIASQTFNPQELAELQAVADSEPIGDTFTGSPALPAVWSLLETDYTQSPFPSMAQVPVSSDFGYRWGGFHGGVDLIPGAGTPVFPIANGVVTEIWPGNNPGGGGYQVVVEHNIGGQFYQSWYPHLQAGSIQVELGQVVSIDTPLGNVGETGRATGPHLHLEIKNGTYTSVDPLIWLQTREEVLEP